MKIKLFFVFLILIYHNSLSAQCNQHLSDSLITQWTFNGNASDLSGNGHNGKVHGAKITTDRCNDSAAYFFNRNRLSQYIQVQNSKELSLANTDYSICAWINATSLAGVIIAKRTGTHLKSGYLLSIVNSQKLGFYIGGGSSDGVIITSSKIVADTTWRFVAVTYKKSNNRFTIYVDGMLDTIYKAIPSPVKTGSFLRIGNDTYYESTTSRNYEFDGTIDDIRMYNRLLDTCEITALYNKSCNSLKHLNSLKPIIADSDIKLNENNFLTVYPNPAKATIQLSWQKSLSNTASIILFDFSGKKILEQTVSKNSFHQQINVSNLFPGIYRIVIIQNGKEFDSKTIIISK